MQDTKKIPSWEELLTSMNSASLHPNDTAWDILRYMNGHHDSLTSQEARMLLASYMKLPVQRPSLLHSCILTTAVKMTERFPDFRFPQFLKIWGYPQNLRTEDQQKQKGNDGRVFLSLKERTEKALRSYALHHPEQREEIAALVPDLMSEKTEIITMVATKMYETERNGRKMRSVKLIGADGRELLADSHQFSCKPWEIVGRLYDVLTRTSSEGNVRVAEVAASQKDIAEVFTAIVGYVDRYDAQHRHYHIFDSSSRHFVAESPKLQPTAGGYVRFCPIVPALDKFKVAIVTGIMSKEEGRKEFGTYDAVVKYVNTEKGYFYYRITSAITPTPEGTISEEGSAQLTLFNGATPAIGQHISIVMFLKRGKDGTKRNAVVEASILG